MEWNIWILFTSRRLSRPEACSCQASSSWWTSQCKGCRRSQDEQLRGKRPRQAREHLKQMWQSPSFIGRKHLTTPLSPTPAQSPLRRNSDSTLPLKRKVALKPSAELHMYDRKLPMANRKEAVPVNEDGQTLGWLSRLRDRRKRELEARSGGGRPARTPRGGPLVVKKTHRAGRQGRQEQRPREIQPPGKPRRQEGQHERNNREKGQVRQNLESVLQEGDWNHWRWGQVTDFRRCSLTLFLTFPRGWAPRA